MIARDVIVELRRRGHEVYLLTGCGQQLPHDRYHLSPINLDLDRMAERFSGARRPSLAESWRWYLFDPQTYRSTVEVLDRLEPDLTVVDSFSLVSIAPLLAAVRSGGRVVAQVNDKWLLHGLRVPGRGLWYCPPAHRVLVAAVQLLAQPVFRRWSREMGVIVNSDFMKRLYLRAGFRADRLHVVHLGIDVVTFQPRTDRSRLAEPVRLMFAGHLWPGKGPQTAIQALAELREQAPETSFTLSLYGQGTPAFQTYLDELARQLGVKDRVHQRGFASQPELAEVFQGHDIFLFTSIWDEPFSITLLQAMSSGIPVVATSAGGNPEVIEPEKTGLLLPPGQPAALAQAVLRLVQDPALRRRISAQASAAVRDRWSFGQYVDTLERLFESYAP